jgi:hypothetical protein
MTVIALPSADADFPAELPKVDALERVPFSTLRWPNDSSSGTFWL